MVAVYLALGKILFFYNDRHGACMAIANKCIGAIGAIGLSADSKRHAAAKLKFLTTFAQ